MASLATAATVATPLPPMEETLPTFERWGYLVHGWVKSPAEIDARPGVLVVATYAAGMLTLIDVVEGSDLNRTSQSHPRSSEWRRHATSGVQLAAIYLDQGMSPFLARFLRDSVVSQIRAIEHPVLGASDVLA